MATAISPRRTSAERPSAAGTSAPCDRPVHLQQCQVGVRVVADPAREEAAAVAEGSVEAPGRIRALRAAGAHHVRIGEQVAVGGEQEAGAAAGRLVVMVEHLHGGDAGADLLGDPRHRLRIAVQEVEIACTHVWLQGNQMGQGRGKTSVGASRRGGTSGGNPPALAVGLGR
jgi:hypothetical protein